MKKLLLLLLIVICIFLTGCQTSKEKEYVRDTSEGSREFITLEQFEEKMANKDTFLIIMAQSKCVSCAELNSILKEYVLNHHVIAYEVLLDLEETSTEQNRDTVLRYFKSFNNTPGIYYVIDGKQVSVLEPEGMSLSADEFDQWIVENKIDMKVEK